MPAIVSQAATTSAVSTNTGMAQASYLSYPDGDIVLRSNNGVDFKAHTVFLRHASPIFQDMFTFPQSANAPMEPVVMSEDAITLDTLLRYIYPLETRPVISTIEQAGIICEAASKLQISCAKNPLERVFCDLLAPESNPIWAWAIAIHHDLPIARRSSTRRFAQALSISGYETKAISELKWVTAFDLVNLINSKQQALVDATTVAVGAVGNWVQKMCHHHTPTGTAMVQQLRDSIRYVWDGSSLFNYIEQN